MNIPEKRFLNIVGVTGFVLLILGLILLVISLKQKSGSAWIGNAVMTTAQVLDVREDNCSRGRWSSRCYDIKISFQDQAGRVVITTLDGEFDAPANDRLVIRYNGEKPEQAALGSSSNVTVPCWSKPLAWLMVLLGGIMYLFGLVGVRRIKVRQVRAIT